MDDKILLNSTELTGIIGKGEIQKLSKVVEKLLVKDLFVAKPCCLSVLYSELLNKFASFKYKLFNFLYFTL